MGSRHTWGLQIEPAPVKGASATPVDGEASARLVEQCKLEEAKMKEWVIDENSVTVVCKTYTRIMLLLAAFIVCGSLAVPFTVGDRIAGVDPFQLTSFS